MKIDEKTAVKALKQIKNAKPEDYTTFRKMVYDLQKKAENAPISDFELMLIENTDSPFGFSSICKRNKKEDVWEYSGFGNSVACSVVTALLKQLARKTQELHKTFKEKDALNLIIDRLLQANGYNTNIASAEDFEDIYLDID